VSPTSRLCPSISDGQDTMESVRFQTVDHRFRRRTRCHLRDDNRSGVGDRAHASCAPADGGLATRLVFKMPDTRNKRGGSGTSSINAGNSLRIIKGVNILLCIKINNIFAFSGNRWLSARLDPSCSSQHQLRCLKPRVTLRGKRCCSIRFFARLYGVATQTAQRYKCAARR